MATATFGRKWLEGILENEELSVKEKAKQIIDGHLTEMDEIKEERDSLKAEAGKAAELQKQLDEKNGGEDYKQKYEDEKKAFEDFKKQTTAAAETAKVTAAYRSLLLSEGISEKRVEGIIKVAEARGDIAKMKLGEEGLENADKLKEAIAAEWGDWKASVTTQGAQVEKPPHTSKNTMTKDEIYRRDESGRYVHSTEERQRAIAENPQLFGKG